ncbi:MAG: mannose-6-phosphate isomerase, class I, partial [Acidimicrobiales bacterium]|nr:mannose-6-phosphate isomerase, class I [Acidimicrobiales bacterium]
PSAPSLAGPDRTPLDQVIGGDPVGALGAAVHDQFGGLPFLLKVLAAGHPLSLQAHPSSAQAKAGFARQDAAGIPVDAPHRSFRDRNHKPELICALTPFDALCGFREPDATLEVLATIDTPALDDLRSRLRSIDGDGLHALLRELLTLESSSAAALVGAVVEACQDPGPDEHADVRSMVVTLGERYPGDAGILTATLLNLVHLLPGEALFLGAGNLHAYLSGTGVEIMANSDNVLRGGLTSKHIDVPTLLDTVDARPLVVDVQRPESVGGVAVFDTPVPEFSLKRLELAGPADVSGPAILLCTDGVIEVAGCALDRGAAAWISAADGPVGVDGQGTLFVAAVGDEH